DSPSVLWSSHAWTISMIDSVKGLTNCPPARVTVTNRGLLCAGTLVDTGCGSCAANPSRSTVTATRSADGATRSSPIQCPDESVVLRVMDHRCMVLRVHYRAVLSVIRRVYIN